MAARGDGATILRDYATSQVKSYKRTLKRYMMVLSESTRESVDRVIKELESLIETIDRETSK